MDLRGTVKGIEVPPDRKEMVRKHAREREVEDVGKGLNVGRHAVVLYKRGYTFSSLLYSTPCLLLFLLFLFLSLTPCHALPSTPETL